jgi:hypothetical protein
MKGERAAGGTTAAAWGMFCIVTIVPYVQWVGELEPGKPLNPYTVFPLLGLWAWSLMWTHYAHGTLAILSPRFVPSPIYKRVSGVAVLALILAHPALLTAALVRDTGGAALGTYAGDGEVGYVAIAAVALAAFLLWEVVTRGSWRQRLGRSWRWVSLAQMVAMALVFVHALALGRHFGADTWFQHYWVALGALLLPCFAVIARADWRPAAPAPQT